MAFSPIRQAAQGFSRAATVGTLAVAGAFFGGYWLTRYLRPRYSPLVLNGAVVVITGASSGIGKAYAEAFAKRGARLVLVARRADVLDAVRREVEPYAAEVLVVPADITSEAARETVIRAALERFGRINILINNAGLAMGGPLELHDPAQIEATILLNLTAAIALARLALPSMLDRGRGTVINVSSIAGRFLTPGYTVYGATKSGLLAFSDALRRELHGTGVEVLSVLPGYTKTPMVPPAIRADLERNGFPLFEPGEVAEQTIKALLDGQNEVFITGPLIRAAAYLDRRYPNLTSLLLTVYNSPMFIDLLRREAETPIGPIHNTDR